MNPTKAAVRIPLGSITQVLQISMLIHIRGNPWGVRKGIAKGKQRVQAQKGKYLKRDGNSHRVEAKELNAPQDFRQIMCQAD
jgi:hypothetical protein